MARPRAFDEEQALDAALELFWRRGFEATSMAELIAATGVCRASLYATYGTKDELYQACLTRYRQVETEQFRKLLNIEPLDAALDALFELLSSSSSQDERGCFVVNAAMERLAHSDATTSQIEQQLGDLVRLFRRRLDRAAAQGEIRDETDTASAADFVVSSIQGLRVVGRVHQDKQRLDATSALIKSVILNQSP